tara:strand:- start:4723 stop:4884 length:162 start_codon:yes stop_codon:yes gene_type:complete
MIKHIFSLLLGVGKKPDEFYVTPFKILVMSLALGIAFLTCVALLLILARLIIG